MTLLFFLGGSGGGGNRGDQGTKAKEVSWNDFFYDMLLKGEVEEIVVHSGVNRATVVLKRGAIYKGQPVKTPNFSLSLAKVENLEDRVREVEDKIGIRPGDGVAITYERKSENIAYIIWGAFILIVFAVLAFSSRNIRMTMGANNPFTKLTKADFTLVDPQIK